MTNRQFARTFRRADKAGDAYVATVTTQDGTGAASSYTRGYTERVYADGKKAGAVQTVAALAVGTIIAANADRIGDTAKKCFNAIRDTFKKDEKKDTKKPAAKPAAKKTTPKRK
jgi:hypothetical protein